METRRQGSKKAVAGASPAKGTPSYRCSVCGSVFPDMERAVAHKSNCAGQKGAQRSAANYRCVLCTATFADVESAMEHKKVCKPEAPSVSGGAKAPQEFKCGLCLCPFPNIAAVLRHQNGECKQASKATTSSDNGGPKKTARRAAAKKPDDSETTPHDDEDEDVDQHQSSLPDKLPPNQQYKCILCNTRFDDFQDALDHQKICNLSSSTSKQRFKCQLCSTLLFSVEEANAHRKTCKSQSQEDMGEEGSAMLELRQEEDEQTLKMTPNKATPSPRQKNIAVKRESGGATSPTKKMKVEAGGSDENVRGSTSGTKVSEVVGWRRPVEGKLYRDTQKFECQFCRIVFPTRQRRANHINVCPEKGKKPLSCKFCGAPFATIRGRLIHEKMCDGHEMSQQVVNVMTHDDRGMVGDNYDDEDSILKCKYCHIMFNSSAILKRHQKACFMGKERYSLTCDYCKEDFPNLQERQNHERYDCIVKKLRKEGLDEDEVQRKAKIHNKMRRESGYTTPDKERLGGKAGLVPGATPTPVALALESEQEESNGTIYRCVYCPRRSLNKNAITTHMKHCLYKNNPGIMVNKESPKKAGSSSQGPSGNIIVDLS